MKSSQFNIIAKDISNVTVSEMTNKTYTGKEITQNVVNKDGDTVLVKDKDYTLEYTNNIEIGTATYIPFFKTYIELPIWIYVPFAIFVILAITNAINTAIINNTITV